MNRAGAAAAGEIALRYRDRLAVGVLVLAGPGNNGGDAWVVARALAAGGARVRVVEPVPAKTDDARFERQLALAAIGSATVESGQENGFEDRGEALVIDGLLGTGATGAPRGAIASAIDHANAARSRGAAVVALDVPSGLDASTGIAAGSFVIADLTLTFGTIKRGQLVNRDACGGVVALDIGLFGDDSGDSELRLVDESWVAANVPRIAADAHKGVRKKLAIVGGAAGMAGAAILAGRSALRSAAGMVKLVVARESLPAVQEAEPSALAAVWPADDPSAENDLAKWADAVAIGPGLGRTAESRELLERVLRVWRGPVLLDADAITLWAGNAPGLGKLLGGRPTLLTPHAAEFSRLSGVDLQRVLNERFEIGAELAEIVGACVLLKGVPTVISSPDGRRLVSASGTPALATGGSGDVLTGIAGTLLAQTGDPFIAGAIAAWIHGRAAERVTERSATGIRGVVLEDIVDELRDAWTLSSRPGRYPVLAELPRIPADS